MPPPEAQGRIHPASVYVQPSPLCLWVSCFLPFSYKDMSLDLGPTSNPVSPLRSLTSNIFNVSFLNKVTFTDREFDVFGDGGFLHLEWYPLCISREHSSHLYRAVHILRQKCSLFPKTGPVSACPFSQLECLERGVIRVYSYLCPFSTQSSVSSRQGCNSWLVPGHKCARDTSHGNILPELQSTKTLV